MKTIRDDKRDDKSFRLVNHNANRLKWLVVGGTRKEERANTQKLTYWTTGSGRMRLSIGTSWFSSDRLFTNLSFFENLLLKERN